MKSRIISCLGIFILLVQGFHVNSQDFQVNNKLTIKGADGDIVLSDDQGTLQFSNTLSPNTAMINMFQSGTNNSTRMILAHSPSFQTWGIQYNDTTDAFTWIGDALPVFQIQLAGQQRIGIGTFAPEAKFHINSNSAAGFGQIKLTETQFDYARITFNNNINNNFWDLAARTSDDLSNAQLNFYHSDVGDILSINATRRIGINDSSPGYPLEVNGNGQSRAINVYNTLPTTNTSSFNYGVIANLTQATNNGTPRLYNIYGFSTDSDSYLSYGVYGSASSASNFNYGVYGVAPASTGYAGYFSGNTYCTGSYLPSDAKLKSNISKITTGISSIMKLQPKEYIYNLDQYGEFNLPDGIQFGLLAQDLESILPNLVKNSYQAYEQPKSDNREDQGLWFKAINYNGLIPVMISAIQEQQKIIEEQKNTIDILIKRLDQVELQMNTKSNVMLYSQEDLTEKSYSKN